MITHTAEIPHTLEIAGASYQLWNWLAENKAHIVTQYTPKDAARPDVVVKFFQSEASRNQTSIGYQTWTQFREVLVGAGFPDILERNEYYQATEFLPGCSTESLTTPLSIAEIHSIIRQVATQIFVLMERKLQHRDVKPGNIILDDKRVKATLSDFDMLRPLTSEPEPTALGTIFYMSPERARGINTLSDDLYALGKSASYYLSAPHGDPNLIVRGAEGGQKMTLQMRAHGFGYTHDAMSKIENYYRGVSGSDQTKLQQLMRFMDETDNPSDTGRPRTAEVALKLLDGNPYHF